MIWMMLIMQYDHTSRHLVFPTEAACEAAKEFAKAPAIRDMICVDP